MATVSIVNKANKLSSVEKTNYPVLSIVEPRRYIKINNTLPFRIKITNILIPGVSQNNIPGIGVQIIGFNNYIL